MSSGKAVCGGIAIQNIFIFPHPQQWNDLRSSFRKLQKVQRAFEDSFLKTPALLTALTFLRLSLLTSSFASSVLFTSTFTQANSAQFVVAIVVGRLKLECIILVYIGFNCIAAWTKCLFLNDKM